MSDITVNGTITLDTSRYADIVAVTLDNGFDPDPNVTVDTPDGYADKLLGALDATFWAHYGERPFEFDAATGAIYFGGEGYGGAPLEELLDTWAPFVVPGGKLIWGWNPANLSVILFAGGQMAWIHDTDVKGVGEDDWYAAHGHHPA